MRTLILLLAMSLAAPVWAGTYSWVDSNGTYNYSDDLSRVPKKYRSRVIKRGDFGVQSEQPAVLPEVKAPEVQPKTADSKDKGVVSGNSHGTEKQLYGGKSYDAWQKEFGRQEAELKRIELELARIRQTVSAGQVSLEQQKALVTEHGTLQAEYNRKYVQYGELVESARKAGLTVEMKQQAP